MFQQFGRQQLLLTNWDTGLLLSLDSASVMGNVFEKNRVAILSGGSMGAEGGTFQGPDPIP